MVVNESKPNSGNGTELRPVPTLDVWFDDIEVVHTEALIVQENHYDPFGLELAGIEKRGRPEHEFKFNEMTERVADLNLGWDMTNFRILDPQLGRFHQIDPLADLSLSWSSYTFASNNPILRTDRLGLQDSIKNGGILPEVLVVAKRVKREVEATSSAFVNWFNGSDVGYSGSGWGHGPRRFAANLLGQNGNSRSLLQLGLNSMLQSNSANLTGSILEKLKLDPAMAAFQNSIIKAIKSDPRYRKIKFKTKGGSVVEFGGQRWRGENESWRSLNPDRNPLAHGETWGVAANELTWAVRHGSVDYAATVKEDGVIVISYHLSDTLDLSGQKGRSSDYNDISNVTGFLYHDLAGGNSAIKVSADWQTTVK
jgi:RHS repeat-associated protein